MAADIDHARIVDRLATTHERRMLNILQQLEDRVAAYAMQAPTQDGRLFDLAWSLRARSDIQQIIRETYLTEADAIIREYDQVFDSINEMFERYESFVGVSPEVVSNLKRVSFQGFQDIAVTFSDDLANELYQNALVGRPIDESIKNLRQKINGVYIQSDQAEIQRLVNIANAGGEDADEAVRELHQNYAADRTGNNMRRYARQMVHDSIMQFDASVNVAAGKDVGATQWKYFGSIVEDSRDHCIKYRNKVLTEDEIRDIWSNTAWEGKAPGDPFIVRGGYNCRHHWRPYFDEFDDTPDTSVQQQEETPKQRMDLTGVKGDQSIINSVETIMTNEADPLAIRVATKLPKPRQIISKKNGGLYESGVKRLTTDIRGPDTDHYAVTVHEYGHHVDYELGIKRGKNTFKAWSEQDGAFMEAFKEDRKALGLVPVATRQAKTFQIMKDNIPMTNGNWDYDQNRYDGNLSDVIDAMAGGIVYGDLYGFGHSKSYWKRKGAKEKECFANMFSLYGTSNWEKVEKIAPRMARRFVQILKEIDSGG